jgi:hypothetical protein
MAEMLAAVHRLYNKQTEKKKTKKTEHADLGSAS